MKTLAKRAVSCGVLLMLILSALPALGSAGTYSTEDVRAHMEAARCFLEENAAFMQQASHQMLEYVQALSDDDRAFFSIEKTRIVSNADGQTVVESAPELEPLSDLFPAAYCGQGDGRVEFRYFTAIADGEGHETYADICLTRSEEPQDESWEPRRVAVPSSCGYWYCIVAEYGLYNDPERIGNP